MLKLFITDYCPWCHKVEDAFAEMGLEKDTHFVLVDAAEGENREFLIEKGGKMQVPYLWIEEEEKGMYESLDIIKYARDNLDNLLKKE